jgi:hypothetical protein
MEALAQVQAWAAVLDVSVGTFGVDEVALPPQTQQAVTGTVDITLCL